MGLRDCGCTPRGRCECVLCGANATTRNQPQACGHQPTFGIVSADTFERPIYAGNAIATVESTEEKLVLTVRGTAFDKAEPEGGAGSASNETSHISLPAGNEVISARNTSIPGCLISIGTRFAVNLERNKPAFN